MKYDVFISYSRRDLPIVQVVCELLRENGITYWYDSKEVLPGDVFFSSIVTAIKNSRITLFISSSNSNSSKYVSKEVAVAFNEGKYIIPYRIDMSPFNDNLKLVFSNINYIDAYPFEREKAKALVKSIGAILKHNVSINSEERDREIIDISQWDEPKSSIAKFFYDIFKDR